MKNKITLRVYYALLLIIALFFAGSGYFEITKNPATFPKNVTDMGYPPYFIVSLGYFKILGCLALLIPLFTKNNKLVRFAEWALVAFLLDVAFAFISEFQIHSQAGMIRAAIVFVLLLTTLLFHLNFYGNFSYSIKNKNEN